MLPPTSLSLSFSLPLSLSLTLPAAWVARSDPFLVSPPPSSSSSALQLWLFGFELPDTVMAVTASGVLVLGSKKKTEFLAGQCDSCARSATHHLPVSLAWVGNSIEGLLTNCVRLGRYPNCSALCLRDGAPVFFPLFFPCHCPVVLLCAY